MRARAMLWCLVAAGCGPRQGPTTQPPVEEEAPAGPQVELAVVPAEALGEVQAASFLIIDADGALAIGPMKMRGRFDVASLRSSPIDAEALVAWTDVALPPLPVLEEVDAGVGILGAIGAYGGTDWGSISGFGDADVYSGVFGDGGTVETFVCGTALRLDAADDRPVALLIPDASVRAELVLDTLLQMPQPTALVARGDGGDGRALRFVVEGRVNARSAIEVVVSPGATVDRLRLDHVQTRITVQETATAQDLLGVLAALAIVGVREVLIDRGETCQVYTPGWGAGFGESGAGWGGAGGDYEPGDYGTIGHGSGTGYGHNDDHGVDAAVPLVKLGAVAVTGDLDQAIVRRYLKRNLSKLSYCYEKQLLVTPGLQGTVDAQFTIEPDGTVAQAAAVGVGNEVPACVGRVISNIEFPKPRDGAAVQVSVPIDYAPTGG